MYVLRTGWTGSRRSTRRRATRVCWAGRACSSTSGYTARAGASSSALTPTPWCTTSAATDCAVRCGSTTSRSTRAASANSSPNWRAAGTTRAGSASQPPATTTRNSTDPVHNILPTQMHPRTLCSDAPKKRRRRRSFNPPALILYFLYSSRSHLL